MTSILYVEDEPEVREGYARALDRLCDNLFLANNGEEGLQLYKQNKPDVVISDIKMPIKNGIEMAREIHAIDSEQTIIFTTAHSESHYLLEAIDLQISCYLLKPVDKNLLKKKVNEIFQNKILEKEVVFNHNIAQQVLNKQSAISFVTDLNKIYFASQSFLDFFSLENMDDLLVKFPSILNMFENDEDYLSAENKKAFLEQYHEASSLKKMVKIRQDEDAFPAIFKIQIEKIDSGIDNTLGDMETLCLVSLTDITQLEEQKKINERKANFDQLTNLYNRRKFEDIFNYELLQSQRSNQELSIAIFDIDHFKKYNDTYGHQSGDTVLVGLSKTILNSIRNSDTFARWGGEEFVLIMPRTNLESAYTVCEKIRQLVERSELIEGQKITISIGVAQLEENDNLKAIFERCDCALYQAKENGRNQVKRG